MRTRTSRNAPSLPARKANLGKAPVRFTPSTRKRSTLKGVFSLSRALHRSRLVLEMEFGRLVEDAQGHGDAAVLAHAGAQALATRSRARLVSGALATPTLLRKVLLAASKAAPDPEAAKKKLGAGVKALLDCLVTRAKSAESLVTFAATASRSCQHATFTKRFRKVPFLAPPHCFANLSCTQTKY